MPPKYRLSPAADKDIRQLAAYIEESDPVAASRFLDNAATTFETLSEFQEMAPKYGLPGRLADIRMRPVHGYKNLLIFYKIEGDTIEVIRVLHAARDIGADLFDVE